MTRPFHHPRLEEITLDGLLHALSDPIRRQIVFNLVGCEGKSCNKTFEGLAPSTLSFHYKVLRETGLVRSEKKGVEVINFIRKEEIESKFPDLLKKVYQFHHPTNVKEQ
ncbi:ArsR/SmtB family transcription factor [Leptospira idonii]|uniref:Transcriptional regulator n=1 Tax=Leptospira idonii TaxID=1193500 RepID=A0A4R9LXF1_9LEPT|nr:helix-turn-helix transcriptional regulator [Leptospira idonii]TGN18231.1 transcriptional regulator [Leptospira idonii]